MAGLLRRRKRKRRVLIDVDTQYDLLWGNGREAGELLAAIRRVMAWARCRGVPVISTARVRRPNANGGGCCIEGTRGQQKVPFTLLGRRVWFGTDNRLDLPEGLLSDYQQVVFDKCADDPFEHPRADRLLTDIEADEVIVFGMGPGVKATVLGLLHRGKRVRILVDALGGCEEHDAEMALRQMEAKGARLGTVAALTGRSRLVGHPHVKCVVHGRR